MNRSPVKAVFFDLDDTLFDHHYSLRAGIAAVQQHYPQLGARPALEVEETYIALIDKWHIKVLAGTLSMDAARVERFREVFEHYGERISLEEANRASDIYRNAYQARRQLIPGVDKLLKHLRAVGIKIVIVTNSTIEEQHPKLEYLGLNPLIDVLVISEEVGVPKPQRRIFEVALERTGCMRDEVVMIGDSWPNDIVGAHHMGIRAVWLNRFGHRIPDARLAAELTTLEPIEDTAALLLGTT